MSNDFDPFEELSNLNTKAYDEGYREGTVDGQKTAFINGFKIGKTMAFAVGKELGECYEICRNYLDEHAAAATTTIQQTTTSTDSGSSPQTTSKDKSIRLANQIVELIDKFDYGACHADNFQTSFNFIKDKFKQFCSLTNVRSFCASQSELNFRLANNPKLSF